MAKWNPTLLEATILAHWLDARIEYGPIGESPVYQLIGNKLVVANVGYSGIELNAYTVLQALKEAISCFDYRIVDGMPFYDDEPIDVPYDGHYCSAIELMAAKLKPIILANTIP